MANEGLSVGPPVIAPAAVTGWPNADGTWPSPVPSTGQLWPRPQPPTGNNE